MSPQLGVLILYLAAISAIYATIAALVGQKRNNPALIESARNAGILTWPLITAASLFLISLLVSGDFSVQYVWQVSSLSMPTYLKVTALWGGQAGSLLFWGWLLCTFTTAALLRNWNRERELMPVAIAASMSTLAFFILLVTLWENPFAQWYCAPGTCTTANPDVTAALFAPSPLIANISAGLASLGDKLPGMFGIIVGGIVPPSAPVGWQVLHAADGQGLNPLLRHFGMVIHPPMLYLGFTGFVVPWAFGMAALSQGTISDAWIRSTRRWTLIAWLFLSLGLILGGRWAYDVLGWGGYWAWDPVENAALLPWLTGTAFLHSVMIQEKQGMMRRWNMVLIITTYLLVVYGTFATRSGVISSVHSFAQSPIGPVFFIFLAAALILSVYLLVTRWDDLAADRQLESLLSRETMFLVNNVLFMSIAFTVFMGMNWIMLSDLLPNMERVTVGPEYYGRATAPMWLGLLLLMGIAPLIAWKKSSLNRLGRAMLWPILFTVAMLLVLYFVLAIHNPLALVGFALSLLTGAITVLEFYRGAAARVRAHGENWFTALFTLFGRNRRRYGGYLIHMGVVVMAIGIFASSIMQTETQRAVAAGQTITLGDYIMEYETLERFVATDGRLVARAQTIIYRNGKEVARLTPRIDIYNDGNRMTIPGTYSSWLGDDFYVRLVDWEQFDLSSATFKVYHNPLINWVWAGGLIFIIGTFVAAWPDFSEERVHQSAPRRALQVGAGD